MINPKVDANRGAVHDLSGKKILIMSEDSILGRMLNHLFDFAGYKTEKRVYTGHINPGPADNHDVELIDLPCSSMADEFCRSCSKKQNSREMPKIILTTSLVKLGACESKSEGTCLMLEKPFSPKDLLNKVNSFPSLSKKNLRQKIYNYYN